MLYNDLIFPKQFHWGPSHHAKHIPPQQEQWYNMLTNTSVSRNKQPFLLYSSTSHQFENLIYSLIIMAGWGKAPKFHHCFSINKKKKQTCFNRKQVSVSHLSTVHMLAAAFQKQQTPLHLICCLLSVSITGGKWWKTSSEHIALDFKSIGFFNSLLIISWKNLRV